VRSSVRLRAARLF